MNTEATIDVFHEIPVELTVTDKEGNVIPNAILSGVVWSQDQIIGTFVLDPNNPNKAIFKPTKPGIVKITAQAQVTIN